MRRPPVLPRIAIGLGVVAALAAAASPLIRRPDPGVRIRAVEALADRKLEASQTLTPASLDAAPAAEIPPPTSVQGAEAAAPVTDTSPGQVEPPPSTVPNVAAESPLADGAAPTVTTVPATPGDAATTSVWPGVTDPDLIPAQRELLPGSQVVSDVTGFGKPWGSAVEGLLTFRGNPTRSFHGIGPVPSNPQVVWRYPGRAMCGNSSEYGVTKLWCGTGWTGQPAVFERGGRTWVVFGAYDYRIHFVDAATGDDIIPPLPTGDIAKGAITVDPDGYPLVYAGSRDNQYRVIAIDRAEPTVLWSLDSHSVGPRQWNDDWDAAGLVFNDWLIEGGENSRVHLVKLNRGYGGDGLVTAAPVLAWHAAGWDDELLRDIGDRRVSLESSVMVLGDTAYFASSGGLVQGWDMSVMRTGVGEPTRTFRFWTGDDTDATIVGDDQGFLYVGVEVDRNTGRGREIGQLLKLDPRRPDDPLVWSVDVNTGVDSGSWSTAAIYGDTVIWATKPGRVYGVNRTTGEVRWEVRVSAAVLSSPSIVDGVMVLGDGGGNLHAFDLGDGLTTPTERWSLRLAGNIESTPAIWKGRIYVGDRSGFMYAIGDV